MDILNRLAMQTDEALTRHLLLLGDALHKMLIAVGVYGPDAEATGPELLAAVEDYTRSVADNAEPVTAEWLLSIGGEKVGDIRKPFDSEGDCGTWPKVQYGPFIWHTNLWVSNGDGTYTATYFLKFAGACLGSSPELTRGQFRHLLAALGESEGKWTS